VRLPHSDLEEQRKLNRENRAARSLKSPEQNKLSPADRLFGVMDYLGPVQFWDAKQVGNEVTLVKMPSFFPPRDRKVKGRKFYKHGQPVKGKTPVEAVPVGEKFRFRCDFSNLSEAEVGLLVIALGQGEPGFNLKLGGGKSVGYGTVGVDIEGVWVYEHSADAYLNWDYVENVLDVEKLVESTLAEYGLILTSLLDKLANILDYSTK